LYYFDESFFSLLPNINIPYGWQKKGEAIELETARSKSLKALGFFRRNNTFSPYLIEGSINSFVVVEVFEDFIASLDPKRKKAIIIDNAPVHTSEYFQLYEAHWKTQNVMVCHLSTYSPELNLIEILWRFVKYQWLPWEAYLSLDHLEEKLWEVFLNVGKKFIISFG